MLAAATFALLLTNCASTRTSHDVYQRDLLRSVRKIYILDRSVKRDELAVALRRELPEIEIVRRRTDADIVLEYAEIDLIPCYDDCTPRKVRDWLGVLMTKDEKAVATFNGTAASVRARRPDLFARQLREAIR